MVALKILQPDRHAPGAQAAPFRSSRLPECRECRRTRSIFLPSTHSREPSSESSVNLYSPSRGTFSTPLNTKPKSRVARCAARCRTAVGQLADCLRLDIVEVGQPIPMVAIKAIFQVVQIRRRAARRRCARMQRCRNSFFNGGDLGLNLISLLSRSSRDCRTSNARRPSSFRTAASRRSVRLCPPWRDVVEKRQQPVIVASAESGRSCDRGSGRN